jgi:UDP-N-acetylmuramate dehydrogenase
MSVKVLEKIDEKILRKVIVNCESEGISLLKNVDLSLNSSIRIGGIVKNVIQPRNLNELVKISTILSQYGLSNSHIFMYGGLTKLVVSNEIHELAITTDKLCYIKWIAEDCAIVGAGTNIASLLNCTIQKSLSGAEPLAGIPGTLGGAIYMNAGTKLGSISQIVKNVRVIDLESSHILTLEKSDCKFNYRSSIFQKFPQLIIVEATLKFKHGDRDLIKKMIINNTTYRKNVQPLEYPNIGCIFLNPTCNLTAGELLELCKLKGKKIGDLEVSSKHSNFIINKGKSSFNDFIKLAYIMKKEVYNNFQISLRPEFNIVLSKSLYDKLKEIIYFLYDK